MRKQERLSAILDRVAERGSVDVNDLASTLGVSGATVRRDLQALSSGKLLVRTHGGAVARLVDTRDGASHLNEKRRIGSAAASLVSDGAVVGFTGGTTTLEVARALAHRGDITFVTNAINIASELVGRPGLRLVVIGGKVTFARICTVSDVDHIVTDRGVTSDQLHSLSSAGALVTMV